MKRNVQPVASPPSSRAGQVEGSVPPKSRTRRPAHGNRKQNATIPCSGQPAVASARPTAITRTGRRSGAPAGNPRKRRIQDPARVARKRRTRTPVPGRRAVPLDAPASVIAAWALRLRRREPDAAPARPASIGASSDLVILLERGHPGRAFLPGANALDRRGGGRQGRQTGDRQPQRRRTNGRLVV